MCVYVCVCCQWSIQMLQVLKALTKRLQFIATNPLYYHAIIHLWVFISHNDGLPYVYTCVCMCIRILCMHMCACMCLYVYVYVHVHTCPYVCLVLPGKMELLRTSHGKLPILDTICFFFISSKDSYKIYIDVAFGVKAHLVFLKSFIYGSQRSHALDCILLLWY